MDSRHKRAFWATGAAALSAMALYFATGLHPVWWLMWIAPLPLLLIAPRIPAITALIASMAAWIVAGFNSLSYYRTLHIPALVIALALLTPPLIFSLAMLLYRRLYRSRSPLLAVLSIPAVWVLYEFASNHNGTYNNLAYTQMDCLPLLQLAAITGMWGISFIVMLIPATIAVAILLRREALRTVACVVILVGGVLAYGALRLSEKSTSAASVTVGFAVSDLPPNLLPEKPADSRRLLTEYVPYVRNLAARGARIILLPEMTAVVVDADIAALDSLYEEAARSTGARILVPIIHVSKDGRYNEARLYGTAGNVEAVYRKHHLVPVFEDRTTPGSAVVIFQQSGQKVGVEICKDMDYLPLNRQYGKDGAGLMIVAAFDFVVDDWLHSRMAILRGVENGFNLARVAKTGVITVTDTRGRLLAEQASAHAPFSTLVTSAPLNHESTLYNRWGNWFAYLNGVLLLLLLFAVAIAR